MALDKYMPTSAERSVGVRRGLKQPVQPLTIMRIQLVMRGGIELESPWQCNRAFGPQDGSLLLRRRQVREEVEPHMDTDEH